MGSSPVECGDPLPAEEGLISQANPSVVQDLDNIINVQISCSLNSSTIQHQNYRTLVGSIIPEDRQVSNGAQTQRQSDRGDFRSYDNRTEFSQSQQTNTKRIYPSQVESEEDLQEEQEGMSPYKQLEELTPRINDSSDLLFSDHSNTLNKLGGETDPTLMTMKRLKMQTTNKKSA